jgi:ATP phosphoribosyltransferase regulatory subunit
MSAHRPFAGALPYGVRDLFLDEAAQISALEDAWRRLFEAWAYVRVIPPTYEHYDVLLTGSGVELEEEVFRVLDREGNILALRSDLTTQVARIVGTKLYDAPLPLRFYYLANVFRYEEPQAGRQREFRQAGVELIGAAGPEADAEVLSLAIEALHRAGLAEFQLNVGHLGLFRGLLAEAQMTPADAEDIRAALNRKDAQGLEEALAAALLPTATAEALQQLPTLCGGPEILDEAAKLSDHPAARAAIERLQAIRQILAQRGLAAHVIFDLGETRGMGYYTGLAFEGFTPGLGFSIVSGGRYDELIGRYGASRPAVGVALSVERVRLALQESVRSAQPDLLAAAAVVRACWGQIERLRGRGLRVEADLTERDAEALVAYARQRGIARLLLGGDAERVHVWQEGAERWLTWGGLAEAQQ